MKKFPSLPLGKRLMAIGAILYALCLVIGFVVNWSTYGKVSDCLNTSVCNLAWEQTVGRIAAIIGYIGLATVAVGLIVLIIDALKRRQQ